MLALCVVDMQTGFDAALDLDTIRACQREIVLAINRQAPVVFLEWSGSGQTLDALLNMVKNYKWSSARIKYRDDGSDQLIKSLHEMSFNPEALSYRVCGVNTDYCVYATVAGIRKELEKNRIEVAWPACNTSYSKERGLKKLLQVSRVRILDYPGKIG